jgi:hypothetical protein
MTSTEATRLDNSNPEFERVQPFEEIRANQAIADATGALVFQFEVDKDATGGLTCLTAPFDMVVTDIQWVTTVGVGSTGEVTILNGENAVCTALAATTAKALSRMSGGVELAKLALAEGETLTIDASGSTITGVLTITGIKA